MLVSVPPSISSVPARRGERKRRGGEGERRREEKVRKGRGEGRRRGEEGRGRIGEEGRGRIGEGRKQRDKCVRNRKVLKSYLIFLGYNVRVSVLSQRLIEVLHCILPIPSLNIDTHHSSQRPD